MAFTTTEHASKKKKSASFVAFTDAFNQNHIYLMFKNIISLVLNIVLEKYEEKKNRDEECLG